MPVGAGRARVMPVEVGRARVMPVGADRVRVMPRVWVMPVEVGPGAVMPRAPVMAVGADRVWVMPRARVITVGADRCGSCLGCGSWRGEWAGRRPCPGCRSWRWERTGCGSCLGRGSCTVGADPVRVMPRVWVMAGGVGRARVMPGAGHASGGVARCGSCPGRRSWRWEWTFDIHEGPTYCGRRNRRRGRRHHRFRRYATRPARANPIVGAVDDHHIPDTRCQPGGRCSGRTVVAWDIPHSLLRDGQRSDGHLRLPSLRRDVHGRPGPAVVAHWNGTGWTVPDLGCGNPGPLTPTVVANGTVQEFSFWNGCSHEQSGTYTRIGD